MWNFRCSLDDIVQQMLHAIEDTLNKRGINQPPKYQECSRKFQINTNLMEKLYADDEGQKYVEWKIWLTANSISVQILMLF